MISRLGQVIKYGWQHSKEIVKQNPECNRISIFFDILYCFRNYKMWSNQYLKESFWSKSKEERKTLGVKFREEGIKRDTWQKDFRENRKFLIKYSNIKYEEVPLRYIRNKKYTERYHAGKNLMVEYDVHLSKQHYLEGSIKIGDNVLLAKHVTIDYSGEVVIEDNVRISDGVIIETHSHNGFTNPLLVDTDAHQEKLVIRKGALIGAKAIILESCHEIGRHARIGAGTIVRFNVPPYAIVAGNPGKIIGFVYTPQNMAEFEKSSFPLNQRLSYEYYENNYHKYYSSKLKEIKYYTKRSL